MGGRGGRGSTSLGNDTPPPSTSLARRARHAHAARSVVRRAGCSPRDDPRTQSRTRGWSRSAHATRHFSHHVRHTVARSKESGSPPTFDSLRVRTSRRRGSISFCVSCSYGAQEAPREDRVVNLILALPPRGCEGRPVGVRRKDISSHLRGSPTTPKRRSREGLESRTS